MVKLEEVFFPEGVAKRALITGAGRGIGREIAVNLAVAGIDCTLVSRTQSELEGTAAAAGELGAAIRPTPMAADLSNAQALEKLCNTWKEQASPFSIVVHAAGIAQSAPIKRSETSTFDLMMNVNARAALILMRELSPAMQAQGFGRFIHIGSVAGLQGYPYVASYCASKHALIGLTRAAAKELASSGITVNAICPGYVDTPMTQATLNNISVKTGRSVEQARADLEAMNPQGRLITPEEIVGSARFLLSSSGRGINGQAISLCGGETA